AFFPAQETLPLLQQIDGFFAQSGHDSAFGQGRFFDWGQGFMLLLAFMAMGFVLRSHATERSMTRPALLVFLTYAAAGYITYAGFGGGESTRISAGMTGSGPGAAPYIEPAAGGQNLALFDILLLESGIAGLALLA